MTTIIRDSEHPVERSIYDNPNILNPPVKRISALGRSAVPFNAFFVLLARFERLHQIVDHEDRFL